MIISFCSPLKEFLKYFLCDASQQKINFNLGINPSILLNLSGT